MTTTEIVQQLNTEIAKLTRVRDILVLEPVLVKRLGRPPGSKAKKKDHLSPEGRASLSASMKARWKKRRKAASLAKAA